jgi:ABC-type transport system substrate-binding protein
MKKLISGMIILSLAWLSLSGCTKKDDISADVLNMAVPANVKGLDPAQAGDLYSNTVIAQIYERLFSYHYLKRPLTLEPRLAASMPEASKDGLTHTFKIKKGIKFQDNEAFPGGKGRELEAKDFIYAWKRVADPNVNSEGWWIFDNRIVGLNEWRDKMKDGSVTYDTEVEGMKALDEHTIQIKLVQPYYQLYYVLAMNYTAPVPKEAVDKYGKEFLNNPVGTGPYMLKSWVRNNKLELVANPTWAGQSYPSEGEEGDKEAGLLDDAGKKLPFIKTIVMREITEDQPRWLNFMKGNLDVAAIPKDNFDSSVVGGELTPDMRKKGIQLIITEDPDVTYTAFNMDDPVLGKSKKLRQAMALAYNGEEVIKKFYNNRAIKAHSPIPPGVDGYEKGYKNPYKKFDVAKAKKFIEEAGFPNGDGLPKFEFLAGSSSTSRQMAEYFKENLKQIGIDLNITQNSWPQFTKKIRERKGQIWGIAWGADYPDAENFLQLFYSRNASPGANGSNYDNPKFDALYEKAALLPPGEERTKLYQQMRDIVVEDSPWIFGAHRLGYAVKHGWLKNYKPHRIIDDKMKYYKIDKDLKAKLKAKL